MLLFSVQFVYMYIKNLKLIKNWVWLDEDLKDENFELVFVWKYLNRRLEDKIWSLKQ